MAFIKVKMIFGLCAGTMNILPVWCVCVLFIWMIDRGFLLLLLFFHTNFTHFRVCKERNLMTCHHVWVDYSNVNFVNNTLNIHIMHHLLAQVLQRFSFRLCRFGNNKSRFDIKNYESENMESGIKKNI